MNWLATAMTLAEQGFRAIIGYKDIWALKAALDSHTKRNVTPRVSGAPGRKMQEEAMPTPRKHESPAARPARVSAKSEGSAFGRTQSQGSARCSRYPHDSGKVRWHAMVYQALALLWAAQGEIQSYMDDRSEAWQESQKAEALQEVKEAILEAFLCAEAIDI